MSDEGRDFDIESDGDKKAHHNALERKRRDHIKDSFTGLRDCVPALHGEKASRAQILKKAADYIHHMKRKNNGHQHDIEDLKKENVLLENRIRTLEKAKNVDERYGPTYNNDNSSVITNTKGTAISAFDGGSGSESSDSEKQTHHSSNSSSSACNVQNIGQGGGRRKKLKTATNINGS